MTRGQAIDEAVRRFRDGPHRVYVAALPEVLRSLEEHFRRHRGHRLHTHQWSEMIRYRFKVLRSLQEPPKP